MGLPAAAIPAAITAAGALASTVGSIGSAQSLNKRGERYARELYEKTKRDNLSFWQMQNTYNSPEAVMERLKNAGLNPNLAYGSGSASNSAGSIASPEAKSVDYKQADFSGLESAGRSLGNYYSFEQTKLQNDNLKKQNDLLYEQIANTQADTLNKTESWNHKRWSSEYKFNQEMGETSMDFQKALLHGMSARNKAFDQQMPHALNNMIVDGQIKAEIKNNLIKDGNLKQFEIDLNKMDLQKDDHAILRWFARKWEKYSEFLPDWIK